MVKMMPHSMLALVGYTRTDILMHPTFSHLTSSCMISPSSLHWLQKMLQKKKLQKCSIGVKERDPI